MNDSDSVYSKAIRAFNLENREESTKHLKKILSDVIERRKNKSFRSSPAFHDRKHFPEPSNPAMKNSPFGNANMLHNPPPDINDDFLDEMDNLKCHKCRTFDHPVQGTKLVECSSCPLLFHPKCHIPNIRSEEELSKSFKCSSCRSKRSTIKPAAAGLMKLNALADIATQRTHIKSDANSKNKNFSAKTPASGRAETKFSFEAAKNHLARNHTNLPKTIDLSNSPSREWHPVRKRDSPSWTQDVFSTDGDVKRKPTSRTVSTSSGTNQTAPQATSKKKTVKEFSGDWLSVDSNQSKKARMQEMKKKVQAQKKKVGKTKK